VTAISGKNAITYDGEEVLPSAIGGGSTGRAQDVTVTINGTTGNTTINASCSGNVESAISKGNGTTDIIGYDEDGKSPFGEDGSVIVRMYNHGSYTMGHGSFGEYEGDLTGYNLGTLYQTVHNRKYMEKNPDIDTSKLENGDLHDWKLNPEGEYKEPTLEEDGYADCICGIDKCGQTKRVVLPKLTPEPSEPDVPGDNTPDTPKQPEGTTPAPVTPDAPVQDAVPDTAPADTLAADTTADAAVVPADAQNVVQDAKPEAAAAASTAAPAAAAVLPQTGANWLAVVGTALSGLFLLAAGFVLNRKNRRMN
jgi:LPXTG-motif cell wall-anchored protein